MAFFDVTLQTSAFLTPSGEPSDFISKHVGMVRKHTDDDDKVTRIGKVRAYRIHANQAANRGVPLHDVCDDHSEELHQLQKELYEPETYSFKEPIMHRFEAVEADCLVLDYIALHPKWRGLKLGLLAARAVIDLLGDGCGLVVSEILPLSPAAPDMLKIPASWVPIHKTDDEFAAAKKKIRGHFRRMGFQRIGRTPYFGMSVIRLMPGADEILKRDR